MPLSRSTNFKNETLRDLAQVEATIDFQDPEKGKIILHERKAVHQLYSHLRKNQRPGLVLFTSGSSGESKAVVHDLLGLLSQFRQMRRSNRTIPFMLFDHIGGINTMLHTLSSLGCLILVRNRNPNKVLKSVEKHKVETLPASPTFFRLMLIAEAHKEYDLSSLKVINYGAEPMSEETLKKLCKIFPWVHFQQAYGLSEVGVLKSKSQDSDSLWVNITGKGYETRVRGGILEIKSESTMLGYLNAESTFTKDGWFITGDSVEKNGNFIKILGRKSEIINVGGEKVYPQEIESVIEEVENVLEVIVYGEKNMIVGNIICAKVSMIRKEDVNQFKKRVIKHCRNRLQNYKVPVKVMVVEGTQYSERFKKKRPCS